ncbi:MAG: hypothetical protein EXR58_04540 [Chloroflexi bacterium]|nr:hypothetical protein [Chloroflexota bacterium]
MTAEDPFDDLLRRLVSGGPIPIESLESLSGLEDATLVRFSESWGKCGPDQRAELIWQVLGASRQNMALDFVAVCQIAAGDPSPVVREQAFQLAAEDGSFELFELCLTGAGDDPDHEARVAAIDAVGVFTLQAQVDEWPLSLQAKAQTVLLDQIHNPHSDNVIETAALLSLSYLTSPESESEIRRAYREPDLHQAAIEAMGRNCQDLWFPELLAELESNQAAYRIQAILACVEMEDDRLVPQIVERVNDTSPEVQLAAIEALGALGGGEAEARLRDLARGADPDLRRAATQALTEAHGGEEFFGIPTDFEDDQA